MKDTQLDVARFQRRYEWGLDQMEQLLSDLVRGFNNHGAGADRNRAYFLGSFIFQIDRDDIRAPRLIIDGQQRLISLSILFAVLRDLMGDEAHRAELDKYLTIPGNAMTRRQPRPVMDLHRGDKRFFETHVVPIAATETLVDMQNVAEGSPRRFKANAERARQWMQEDVRPERYVDFAVYVAEQCEVILIEIGKDDDAFRIFETVNNRGLPLRESDILRETLVELATDDEKTRSELLTVWDRIESSLQERLMNRFIAQLHLRCTFGRPTDKGVHRDICDSFGSREEALAFLKSEMRAQANIFRQVATAKITGMGQSRIQRGIAHRLASMNLAGFADWMPIAVVLFERLHGTPQELERWLAKLDALVWYFQIEFDSKNIAAKRESRFAAVLTYLLRHDDWVLDQSGLDLLEGEIRTMVSELHEAPPNWVPLKWLLVRIEYMYQHNNWKVGMPGRPDLDKYTIEHVLPRHPTGGDSAYWFPLFNKNMVTLEGYSRRLGNHCLVEGHVNSQLDTKPFPEKKAILQAEQAASASYLVEDVLREELWDQRAIGKQTGRLVRMLRDEWDLWYTKQKNTA